MAVPNIMPSTPRSKPLALLLTGCTATGKSALALEVARRWPVQIISLDSVMVYRGADIGSAKPPAQVLRAVPHALVNICAPTERYSAGRFVRDLARELARARAHRRVPLLVGGTMLYVHAALAGLAGLPPASPEVRARLAHRAAAHGWATLHAELARRDPPLARQIAPTDTVRIARALEIWEGTGMAPSAARAHYRRQPPLAGWRCVALGLQCPTDAVNAAIEQRTATMCASGLVAETERLAAQAGTAGGGWQRAIGYRQVLQHTYPNSAALCDAVALATRRLAKRQRTWMRKLARQHPLVLADTPTAMDNIESALRQQLEHNPW